MKRPRLSRLAPAAGVALALIGASAAGATTEPPADSAASDEPAVAEPSVNCDGASFQVAFSGAEGTASTVQYPIYVAIGGGMFDAVGLDVETIGLGGTANILGAVISNDADVGILTMPGVLQAANEGAPVKAITGLQFGATLAIPITQAMMEQIGLQPGDVVTADDIAKAVGLQLGTTSIGGGGHTFAQLVLSAGGLVEGDDWEAVALADSAALVAAFGQNVVDAISASSSTSGDAVEQFGGGYLFDPFNQTLGDISPELAPYDLQQGAVAVASAGGIEDPDRAAEYECFADAMRLANHMIINDPAAAGEAAWGFFEPSYGEDREAFDELALNMAKITSPSLVISTEAIDATIAYLGQTPETAVDDVTYEQTVDPRFAETVEATG